MINHMRLLSIILRDTHIISISIQCIFLPSALLNQIRSATLPVLWGCTTSFHFDVDLWHIVVSEYVLEVGKESSKSRLTIFLLIFCAKAMTTSDNCQVLQAIEATKIGEMSVTAFRPTL
jgi:hypothetical protein